MEDYHALAFSGKNEDFLAWSTRFTAYLQTKDLYQACVGKEAESEEGAIALAVGANNAAKTEHENKLKNGTKKLQPFMNDEIKFCAFLLYVWMKQASCT